MQMHPSECKRVDDCYLMRAVEGHRTDSPVCFHCRDNLCSGLQCKDSVDNIGSCMLLTTPTGLLLLLQMPEPTTGCTHCPAST